MVNYELYFEISLIILGALIVLRMIFARNPAQDNYQKLYHEVLTSDKYKVKGQFDKEE